MKRNLDVLYWERCIDLELCPNFLKFRPPRLKQYRNVQQMYKNVVEESLAMAKDDLYYAEQHFHKLKEDIDGHLGCMDRAVLSSLLNKEYRSVASDLLKIHNDKLIRLWKTQKPKCPNCVVNLSKKVLSLEDESVLYRGLKRNVTHKKVPVDEIKTAVEDCINTAVLHEAQTEFADMPAPTSNSAERERKTALYDRVNNIAKTKCDASFRDTLKGSFNKFITSAKYICNTRFNRMLHATVDRLAKDSSIKVCKFDKGNGLVLLDTDDYYTKLDVIINDTTKFRKVDVDENNKHPLVKKENSIKDYLYRYFRKHVDTLLYKKLYPCGSAPGKMYGLCKVHKEGNPMRPVVSMIGTAEYELAKYLDNWIKPYIPSMYMVNSTEEFLAKINEVPIENGDYCISFDVKSLFTNVPLEETIKIITKYIFADKNHMLVPMSELIFKRLLKLATQGMFIYKNILYQQVDGVTMGNCLGPTLANFFLAFLEVTKVFKMKKSFHPKFYARYVDDIYCVFSSRVQYLEFFGVLNSLHPNIEFTAEVGTNKLPFLDVEIELLDNQVNSWVYRKDTNTNVIMNFHDIAPKSWKMGLVYCFLNRAYNVCSSSSLFQKEVRLLQSVFLQNSYTVSFFKKVYDNFMKKKNAVANSVTEEVDEGQRRVIVKLPYFGKCSILFARNFCSLMEGTFDLKMRACYTSVKLQRFFPLKSPTPFQFQSNVVYRFDCVSNPRLFYIGQTARHLIERANEHLEFSDKESAVAAHIKSCPSCQNTTLTVQNFSILKKCHTKFQTKIFEALYIQKLHPTLNVQLSNDGSGYLLKIFR